jgi:hypothetical protein
VCWRFLLGYATVWLGDRFLVSWRIVLTVVCGAKQCKKNSWLSFTIFLGLLDLWPFKMKTVCSFDTQEPLAHWHSVPEPSVSPPCEPPVWWLLYCLGALKNIIQCQWAVISDKVMLALLCLCVNADAGNLILLCLWPHPTAWEHFVWSSVSIWGDGRLGRGHHAGFSGPVAECHDDVGMKQSQVCSVTEFRNFSPGGASVVAHVSTVQMAAIVTMYSASWHAAQDVLWPGPRSVCIERYCVMVCSDVALFRNAALGKRAERALQLWSSTKSVAATLLVLLCCNSAVHWQLLIGSWNFSFERLGGGGGVPTANDGGGFNPFFKRVKCVCVCVCVCVSSLPAECWNNRIQGHLFYISSLWICNISYKILAWAQFISHISTNRHCSMHIVKYTV